MAPFFFTIFSSYVQLQAGRSHSAQKKPRLCIWGDRFNILCPNKQFCAQERTKFLAQEDSPVQKLHRTFHLVPWTYPHTCNVTKYKALKLPSEEFLFTFKLSSARRLFHFSTACARSASPKENFFVLIFHSLVVARYAAVHGAPPPGRLSQQTVSFSFTRAPIRPRPGR